MPVALLIKNDSTAYGKLAAAVAGRQSEGLLRRAITVAGMSAKR